MEGRESWWGLGRGVPAGGYGGRVWAGGEGYGGAGREGRGGEPWGAGSGP